MTESSAAGSSLRRVAAVAALATFAGHLLANPHYGFFRDELYFIVCGRHPAFGYVDQPPLVPLAAALSQIFGTSLFLVRAVAALAAAAAVYVCGLLAIELGGGAFAVVLTAICVALAPVLAAFGAKLGTDTFMLWTWPLAALFAVRATTGGDARWWIGAGVAIGIAAQSKYSVAFFAFALLAGLALTPQRSAFLTRGFWLGVAAAIAIALPNAAWQAAHGFPMLELLRNGQHGKNVVLSPLDYLVSQLVLTGLLLALVWLAGLVWLAAGANRRWLAIAYAILLATMIALHAKDYYPAAIYPVLFAAGGVAIEAWTRRARVLRPLVAAVAILCGLAFLPLVEPVLPVPTLIGYMHVLGGAPSSSEHHRMGALPQDFADMHGWPELTQTVARVYASLSPAERSNVAIFASNYGEAGAIDVFGGAIGLPHAIAGHNSYYLWGPGAGDPRTVIDVNGRLAVDRTLCTSAVVAATVDAPYAMPYEQGIPIIICRGLRAPLAQLWPRVKVYI